MSGTTVLNDPTRPLLWDRNRCGLPPFGTPVLKPRFDLCVGHLERLGQGRAVHGRQVSVFVELLLELRYLAARERRARLFPLGRRPVLVRVSDAPGAEQSSGATCRQRKSHGRVRRSFIGSQVRRQEKERAESQGQTEKSYDCESKTNDIGGVFGWRRLGEGD